MVNYLAHSNKLNQLETIDPVRQEIIDGMCFFSTHLFESVDDDDSKYIYISTNNIKIKAKFYIDTDQNTDVYLYENSVIDTSGNEITPINFDRNSSETLNASVYSDPVVDTSGNTVYSFRIFASSTNPAKGGVGGIEPEYSFLLKPNTNYILKVVNKSGGTASNIQTLTRYCNMGGL